GGEEGGGIGVGVGGGEGVRGDELGQRRGLVGSGGALRPHFVEDHRNAARRDLPGRLGPGEPAADDVHWLQALVSHGTKLRLSSVGDNVFVYTKLTRVLVSVVNLSD